MADVEKQLQKLIKVGGEMGMHGEELRKWVDKQLEDERQAKREEREALIVRIKEEREKIKRQAVLAEKQIELERLRLSKLQASVRRGLVKPQVEKIGKQQQVYVYLADGKAVPAPVTDAHLESPYFTGKVSALEMANPMYDVILGNIPGAKCPGISLPEPKPESKEICKPQEDVMAVETRAGKMRRTKPLMTSPPIDNAISVSGLKRLQKQDESLALCRKLADTGETRTSGKENRTKYGYDEKGILIRMFATGQRNVDDGSKQVVVPQTLRNRVMQAAHDSIVGGHLAAKKTTDKILSEFFWPNIWEDVKRYCQSCDQCQRSSPKGQTAKVPLSAVPLIDEPFSRVAVDLVGPIVPSSERGYKTIHEQVHNYKLVHHSNNEAGFI
ncbi:gypsy retrotransposon integrase-like protein 1 [Plakobranchus ocellatus]|uniref:Gypsy retrotransposon integrase-like protein 1 n=1 Tax=Plakobranchus ocellatus TaxID=259542 RepID=A0AAV4BU57_9GAST|nr:gypsy retrotransposon integrase-like protein 1 [Plakobranchus ocellatus]